MTKHIKFKEESPGGKASSFSPNSQNKQQQQGTKRKRDFENGEKKSNGIVLSQKQNVTSVNGQHGNPSQRPSGKPTASPLSESHKALLRARSKLPIHPHTSAIRRLLASPRHLLVLSGSTGSGKSTQVPQMLMDEDWCTGGCIAVTQPRRVAAISLAVRVAQEMGTTLGKDSRHSKVGYAVRFDENVPPKAWVNVPPKKKGGVVKKEQRSAMRIKYLTEGMLVQEIARDPWLKAYKCVVVDEVHERSVNVDLILGFLRRILVAQEKDKDVDSKKVVSKKSSASGTKEEPVKQQSGRAGIGKLKVVVMSATADTEAIFNFFEAGFEAAGLRYEDDGQKSSLNNASGIPSTNGHTEETKTKDDISETSWDGLSSSENNKETAESATAAYAPKVVEKHVYSEHVSTCHVEGRQYPVDIMYAPAPEADFVEAALKTIFQIHYKEPLPGNILVFLTGQDTVESLERLVREYAAAMGPELPKVRKSYKLQ